MFLQLKVVLYYNVGYTVHLSFITVCLLQLKLQSPHNFILCSTTMCWRSYFVLVTVKYLRNCSKFTNSLTISSQPDPSICISMTVNFFLYFSLIETYVQLPDFKVKLPLQLMQYCLSKLISYKHDKQKNIHFFLCVFMGEWEAHC